MARCFESDIHLTIMKSTWIASHGPWGPRNPNSCSSAKKSGSRETQASPWAQFQIAKAKQSKRWVLVESKRNQEEEVDLWAKRNVIVTSWELDVIDSLSCPW
jgi:hypothetical protein